jgi:ankyrin repeat protein
MAKAASIDEIEFVKVCVEGNCTKAAEFLDSGADAGQRIPRPFDYRNGTVLHIAAALGQTDMVNLLLSKGAFVGACDHNVQTPLHRACAAGQYETAQILIKHGARVNFSDLSSAPLHLACEAGAPDVVRLLLGHHADVNSVIGGKGNYYDDMYGYESDGEFYPYGTKSPLYVAYDNNKIEVARVLIQHGAKCDLMRRIHLACLLEDQNLILKCLSEGEKINVRDTDERTPLHIAARGGHVECVKLCLRMKAKINKTDKRGRTALHYAAQDDHVEVVEHLLSYLGIYVNVPDSDDYTPLHIACKNNHLKVVESLVNFDPQVLDFDTNALFLSTDINIIALLLEVGVRVNCKDAVDNSTLLHKACRNGDQELVELLLQSKAKVNGRENMSGMTPLHLACKERHTDIALTLIQHGAQVNAREFRNGYSPLHFACETGDIRIVEALLEKRCDLYFETNQECGIQPLEIATKRGFVENVELLLKYAVAEKDDDDMFITKTQQPLYLACEYRYPKLVKLFLQHGASVDCPEHHFRVQLFDVVIHSYIRCLELENADQCANANDCISILIELINAGCRLEHFFSNMGCELSHLYEAESVFAQKRELSRFLMMTAIDIFDNVGDAYLMSILRNNDVETLRALVSCGYRFGETRVEDLCSRFDDSDSLLAEVREVIFNVPSLQDLCRLKVRCILRRNLHLEAELRRKRHLSTRIGDYLRKFAGKKRKRLPIYGINKLIDSLPLPNRVKDFLCFNLFDVS